MGLLNFTGWSISCKELTLGRHLAAVMPNILLTRFHRRYNGSGVTAGLTASMLANVTFEKKDGAHVLCPLGGSAHGIQCPHAFRMAKPNENGPGMGILEVFGLD